MSVCLWVNAGYLASLLLSALLAFGRNVIMLLLYSVQCKVHRWEV